MASIDQPPPLTLARGKLISKYLSDHLHYANNKLNVDMNVDIKMLRGQLSFSKNYK